MYTTEHSPFRTPMIFTDRHAHHHTPVRIHPHTPIHTLPHTHTHTHTHPETRYILDMMSVNFSNSLPLLARALFFTNDCYNSSLTLTFPDGSVRKNHWVHVLRAHSRPCHPNLLLIARACTSTPTIMETLPPPSCIPKTSWLTRT